ncbi:DUF5134 domain-containing protein [Nocardia sp. NBC_01503]|uniref:DUF5134 domain-containing protein n=1 Tax=Nocardia sp. NBC_01503 TaxID=2975997 RepID=UPI002E7C5592|nr:DUF5134 domain-containing protein [Nocardia sp. NBC_01503]WTL29953.1 DUF5134 domain-containing protein [Nocardia sp. NBC_01503]
MTGFVQEYGALRWVIAAAFGVAVVIVLGRLAAVRPAAEIAEFSEGIGGDAMVRGSTASPRAALASGWGGLTPGRGNMFVGNGIRGLDQESDAAHLLMCMVMLAMLVFPATADPRALRGVLTAMLVVYAALLMARIMRWRSVSVTAIGYHLLAAGAMLYAMSGHAEHGMPMDGGPSPGLMLTLAALFTADAVVMAVPWSRRALRHMFPHPVGTGPTAVVPHLVMDVGTAYMLVLAAAH